MGKIGSWLLVFIFLLSLPSELWAAAALQRVQQMKAQQQAMAAKQYQEAMIQKQMYGQQVAAQKQAQQMAVYQKAAAEMAAYKQGMALKQAAEAKAAEQYKQMVAQRQMQQVQYQHAVQVKQVQNAVAQKQAIETKKAVEQQAQVALNQQVQTYAGYMARKKAVMAAQVVAVKQAQVTHQLAQHRVYQNQKAENYKEVMQKKLQEQELKRKVGNRRAAEILQERHAYDEAQLDETEEESLADIQDVWNALDESALLWEKIVDYEVKVLTVSEYIDRFHERGIAIKYTPGRYATLLDRLWEHTPEIFQAPFMNVLSYAAVMEYDFDNGQNKDQLAREMLGESNFLANKKRLQAR